MRKVDPRRFLKKQPEEFDFRGEPLADSPPPKSGELKQTVPPSARPDGRTSPKESQVAPRDTANAYIITIPENRRKVRHPFDIYDDQLEAMEKLQIAIREVSGSKTVPTSGGHGQSSPWTIMWSRSQQGHLMSGSLESKKMNAWFEGRDSVV